MTRRAPVVAALLLALAPSAPAAPQAPGHTPGSWQRVETEHFLFLYPAEMADWTLAMARRMESVHEAVTRLVGYTPEDRITVLVDDPSNVSNGSMNPGPLLYVWPTPPDARSMVGENRGWGEILAVHEYAHAVHLTRPTRNPVQRFLWSLAPIPITPMMLQTPRWLTEGYATWVEGELTGSGRPHGVWRPAVLRTWALEGQLPTYGAVSGTGGYLGGAMAYLVGSAYLEWLVEREGRGSEPLTDLWARMTARTSRSFPQAFTGVFGRPPDELYGHFTVEVTAQALAARRAVEAVGGVVEGELFQRLSWTTGDPAVSPDGERIALVLASEDEPGRVVVFSSTPDTVPTAERERLERMLEEDPQDVAPVRRLPRAQKEEAVLHPDFGHPFARPRWLPNGKEILVIRDVAVANARTRPELFAWAWETGELRQVTHGQAIREADPAPDGRWAVGLRCEAGYCDLVRIELGTGDVATLARSDLLTPYAHPRLSPDGRTIVANRNLDGRWRVVALNADGSGERILGPNDGAARLDAAFLPDGSTLVLTSTRGGVPNLELLELETGAVRPLTRTLGAAVAPAPSPSGEVFFLTLHSRGWDLRTIGSRGPSPVLPDIGPEMAPAAPVGPTPAPPFEAEPLGEIRPYGLGPRFGSYVPLASFSEEGYTGGVAVNGTDPIGRFTWQLRGMLGEEKAWRGGALDLLWRPGRPSFLAEGFLVDGPLPRPVESDLLDADRPLTDGYRGALAGVELSRWRDRAGLTLRMAGSTGRLEDEERTLGAASLEVRARQSPGKGFLIQSARLEGSVGRTGTLDWSRWLASGGLEAGGESLSLGLSATAATTDAPVLSREAFQVGGTEPLLLDPLLLSQRLPMPALAPGFLRGKEVVTARVDLRSQLLGGLFFWAGDAADDQRGWYRMVGSETSARAAPLPYLRIPSVTFRVGSAYLLDEPGKGTWRWWLTLGWRP